MLGHRLPQRGVHRVVVDDQHLEVGVVEAGERIERLAHHVRRLVADRQVDADLGQRAPAACGGDQRAGGARHAEHGFGQLEAVGHQQEQQQCLAGGERAPDDFGEVARGTCRPSPAAPARRWRRRPAPGRRPAACRGGGCPGGGTAAARPASAAPSSGSRPRSASRRFRDRAAHRPFGLAIQVDHAPVAGGAALEAGLPGLVEGFHDEVVEAARCAIVEELAHETRLVDPAGTRAADGHAVGLASRPRRSPRAWRVGALHLVDGSSM